MPPMIRDVGKYLQKKSILIGGVSVGDPSMLKLAGVLKIIERKDSKSWKDAESSRSSSH